MYCKNGVLFGSKKTEDYLIKIIGLLLETKKILDSKKKIMHVSHFPRMLAKTCFKSFRKFPEKNVLSSVPFKQFDLSNPPTYNRTEADSTPKISRECSRNL